MSLRPHTAGSELLELSVLGPDGEKLANIVFTTIQDRRGRSILSVRDQNTFDTIAAAQAADDAAAPVPDPPLQGGGHPLPHADRGQPARSARACKRLGIFESTNDEVGEIIVADVNAEAVAALVKEADEREKLITKTA